MRQDRALIEELVVKTKQVHPAKLDRDRFTYIDISSIDRVSKTISDPQTLEIEHAPSRARKLVQSADVLVATVRPNLNSVAIVPNRYAGEIASTGFCVLRPKPDALDPRFLFYFCQTQFFIRHLTEMSTGAGYPAVSDEDILQTSIPLPPLTEQKRIAALLEKADRVRRLRRYAREMSEGFLQSVFREMFGDPVRNEKGWDRCEMDDIIAESQYGTSHKSNSEGIGYPVIGMGDLSDLGYLNLKDLSYVNLDKAEFQKLKLVPGDIVFNRTNSPDLVGKTALFEHDGDYVMASYLVKLKVTKDILPEFFVALLNTKPYKAMFQKRCKKAVNQANISPTLLKEFPAIKPPIAIQEKFRDVRQKVVRQIVVQKEAERQAEHLFQTLLHQAFAEG